MKKDMYLWEKYGVTNTKSSPEDYDNVVLVGGIDESKFKRIVKELFSSTKPDMERVNREDTVEGISYEELIELFTNKILHFVVIFDNYKKVTIELVTFNAGYYRIINSYSSEELYKLDIEIAEKIILEQEINDERVEKEVNKSMENKIIDLEIKSKKKETKKVDKKLTTDDINAIIGKNIRYERQKRDLTIEDLSNILNINQGFLGLIERGTRGTNNANLVKISKFFQITLDQLMTKDIPNDELNVLVDSEERLNLIKTVDTYVDSFSNDEIKHFIEVMKSFKRLNSSEMYSEE